MSTAKFNTWLNPDGTQNYKCRAWVNFNGTGTVAIRAAGNVTSITDNGTGDYTVNFTTVLTDANYSVGIVGSGAVNTAHTFPVLGDGVTSVGASVMPAPTTSAYRFKFINPANGAQTADQPLVCSHVFR